MQQVQVACVSDESERLAYNQHRVVADDGI